MKLFILAALVAVSSAASTTAGPVCADDENVNCWSRPDADCFGIYEPWSRVHCPSRCGFCGTPPCEDVLTYCSQFEHSSCIQPSYQVWARQNCRKTCGLCHDVTAPTTHHGGGHRDSTTAVNQETPTEPPTTAPPVTTQAPVVTTQAPVVTTQAPAVVDTTQAAVLPFGNMRVAMGTVNTFMLRGALSANADKCVYKDVEYAQGERWNDGCQYECSCMDTKSNRMVCIEKCTAWTTGDTVGNCQIVNEPNECCPRLECN